jgi:hypothetical protein
VPSFRGVPQMSSQQCVLPRASFSSMLAFVIHFQPQPPVQNQPARALLGWCNGSTALWTQTGSILPREFDRVKLVKSAASGAKAKFKSSSRMGSLGFRLISCSIAQSHVSTV